MRQEIKYNEVCDLCEVDQFGYIDITKAFKNGYVPGTNQSVTLEFDDCDDPSAIIGKPGDVFEAMRMQDSLIDGMSNNGSSAKADEN